MNFSTDEILEWKKIIPELQHLSDEEVDNRLSCHLTELECENISALPESAGYLYEVNVPNTCIS